MSNQHADIGKQTYTISGLTIPHSGNMSTPGNTKPGGTLEPSAQMHSMTVMSSRLALCIFSLVFWPQEKNNFSLFPF